MNLPLPIPLQRAVVPKETGGCIREIARRYMRKDAEPRFVDVVPLSFCSPQDCHRNVEQAVRRWGGSVQTGWAISHVPGEYYEFAAHSIWIRPDQLWVDITPVPETPRRLFVPDDSVLCDGTRPVPTRFFADGGRGTNRRTVQRMNALAQRISMGPATTDARDGSVAHSELSRLVAACIQRSARRGWRP